MSATEIARAVGLRKTGANCWRGPCPLCGGRRRFQIREGRSGPLVWCWARCNPADLLAELRRRGLLPERERPELSPAERRAWAEHRRRDERDLEAGRQFRAAADLLIDELLETLPVSDLSRGPLTAMKAAMRTDAGLLAEYRDWREREPELTAALVAAGRNRGARLEMMLQHYLLGGAKNAA